MPASLARRQVHGKRAVSVAGYFFVGFFFLPAVAAAALIGFFVVLAIEHL
jgi:tetrahydromethanopterin S-methyltransferase subunit D